jgi:hypothetical protein
VIAAILSLSQQRSRISMRRKASRMSLPDVRIAGKRRKRLLELQAGETGRCMKPLVLLAVNPHRFLLNQVAKDLFIAGRVIAQRNSVVSSFEH